jgi:hypothetical protein
MGIGRLRIGRMGIGRLRIGRMGIGRIRGREVGKKERRCVGRSWFVKEGVWRWRGLLLCSCEVEGEGF